MYLTKIKLNIESLAVRRALGDCQQMHRLVNGLYDAPRADEKILYRIRMQNGRPSLYLYSDGPVMREKILPFMEHQGERDLSQWLQTLTAERVMRFDLVTMPSKKTPVAGAKNSQRRILRSREERLSWLRRKAEQNGFVILDVQELESSHITGRHDVQSGGKFDMDAYHYNGVLKITDAEGFQKAVVGGIGSGKAYGLGMLLLS